MKKNIVLKGILLAVVLISNILTSCFGFFYDSSTIETAKNEINILGNQKFEQTEVIKETDLIKNLFAPVLGITSIDLTGLATGTDAMHTHIYEKKYDDGKHWEECFICKQKRNETLHSLSVSGTYGCASGYGYQKEYCKDGCGYSKQLAKQPHTNSDWINDSSRNRHQKRCLVCSNMIGSEQCYNSEGKQLGCATGILGTCVVCGHEYTSTKHTSNLDHGTCNGCGTKLITGTNSIQKISEGTSRVTWKFKPVYSNVEIDMNGFSIGCWSGAIPSPTCKLISATKDPSTGEITVVGDLTLTTLNAAQSEDSRVYGKLTIDGNTHNFNLDGNRIYPDNYVPTKVSTTVTGNGTINKFSQKAQLTAIFKDTWDSENNLVYMRLLDKDQKTVISGWGAATKNGTNWTKVFDIVAETKEATSIYVQAKDACGNTTELIPVTIQYIDAKAPTLTSSATSDTAWAKSKDIIYTATDGGVENISIAFNNQNDFQVGTKNGNTYSRTYTFYGDVYESVVGALYLKDSLGNITTKKVTISKLDGTAPTITETSIKNNIITVIAHDQRSGMGEGSGVSSYRYIASSTKLTNPSITTTNSTLVTGKATGTGSLEVNNIADANYVYVSAVDAVGNIGTAVEVPVPKLTLENTIDLTAQEGKGGVVLTWTIDNSDDKLYSIYQQDEGEATWTTINEKKVGTTLTTSTSKDIAEPNKPTVTVNGIENNKIKISQSVIDNGSTYSFYVEAYDKANVDVLLARSNQVIDTVTTGIKGYYYITDDNEVNDFNIADANFVTGEEIQLDIEHNGKYIHIKAVDNAGNISNEGNALIWIESQATVDPNEGNIEGDENSKVLVGLVGKTIDLGTPVRKGYRFLGWSATAGTINGTLYTYALEPGIITANWEINDYAYKVEYYYNGIKDKQATETGMATYMTQVDSYTPKEKFGYKFDIVENLPLTVTENENSNVIKVYYKSDQMIVKEVTYEILYYKDGVVVDRRVVTRRVQILLPDKVAVDKNLIETDRYNDADFIKTEPAEIPNLIESGEIISVYYESKISQVVVKYVDQVTGELIGQDVLEGKVGEEYTITEKELDGYTLIESSELNGTYTEEVQEKTFYYAKNAEVKVKYLEKDTDEILESEEIITGYEGKEFETTKKDIENYELVEVVGTPSGTMSAGDSEVIYYYAQKTRVIVNYIDILKDENIDSEIIEGKVGDEYEAIPKDFDRYILIDTDEEGNNLLPENNTGLMTKDEIVVNYYYKQISEGVIEKHIDKANDEILENTLYEGNVGDEYTTAPKEFEEYDLDEENLPENSQGVMTEELIEVKYYYMRKALVKVQYIDRNTNEAIAEELLIEGHEGDLYETEPEDVEEYYLVESMMPENSVGTMTKDEILVTYYYAKKSAGVIEKHIDKNVAEEILAEEFYEGLVGDEYTTAPKEFEGYDLDKENLPQNSQGKMTEEVIEVCYYYERITTVKVEHIDEKTDEVLESQILKGHEGDEYKTSPRKIKDYKLDKERLPENAEGIMEVTKNEDGSITSEIVVKYYYKKVSVGVLERHIDIKTDDVLEEQFYSGNENDDYKTSAKEYKEYDLVKEKMPENAEGKMTVELIEVDYYYIRKATVRVQYVDNKTGKKISEDTIINGHEDDEYKTTAKEIKDYTLDKKKLPENAEGIMKVVRSKRIIVEAETETVVTYYYDKVEKEEEPNKPGENPDDGNKPDKNPGEDNSNNDSNNNSNNNTNNNENNGNNNNETIIIGGGQNNSNTTSKPSKPNKPVVKPPATGDTTLIIATVIMILVALINMVQIFISRKRKANFK